MSTPVSLNLTWWAVEAVSCLSDYDLRQASTARHRDDILKRYQERLKAQTNHDYGLLLRQLIETSDSECLACAASYERAVKTEK
jgi:hypothetical protein